ncbi:MAG: hypothetical protein IKF47_01795 [Bacilli bacterium]|nr:hypothetical protein [Bacilli bacterium]
MKNNRRKKKIRNLIIICFVCAIIVSVGTYAWFIGMKTVNVSSFDVEIATTEGLFLSMDGEHWSYQLDAKNATPYTGNTNTWASTGLIPISSVGDIDSTVSRLQLYEKGSLTTTKGGYRLLASRVHNYDHTEQGNIGTSESNGYVAFDLFIKNISGTEYYAENNILNEEDIYLTTNSAVTVATNGGVAGTGIENSVRVAFAQIGRVEATDGVASVDNITGITCTDVAATTGQAQVTGICRQAQIWEPNDKAHVQNAINWYETSCKTRKETGTDVTLAASYDTTACSGVADNAANKTYAISRVINIADNVDIYDGAQYNTYEDNTIEYATYDTAVNGSAAALAQTEDAEKATAAEAAKTTARAEYKLVDFPYFTDTMKNLTSTERPTFMKLAPNSITKVRVYIWIEGQDVDNYDFASLGRKISVNFGFTKERYTEDDIDYEGPSTDITPVENNNQQQGGEEPQQGNGD